MKNSRVAAAVNPLIGLGGQLIYKPVSTYVLCHMNMSGLLYRTLYSPNNTLPRVHSKTLFIRTGTPNCCTHAAWSDHWSNFGRSTMDEGKILVNKVTPGHGITRESQLPFFDTTFKLELTNRPPSFAGSNRFPCFLFRRKLCLCFSLRLGCCTAYKREAKLRHPPTHAPTQTWMLLPVKFTSISPVNRLIFKSLFFSNFSSR